MMLDYYDKSLLLKSKWWIYIWNGNALENPEQWKSSSLLPGIEPVSPALFADTL